LSYTKAYTPSVAYKYVYQGKEYWDPSITDDKTISTNKKKSEDVVKRYPVANAVTAYVNPNKPSEACLEPGNTRLKFFC
jgi:hypothetical protein